MGSRNQCHCRECCDMGCGASSASATAPDNTHVVPVTDSDTRRSGMLLDCGSGHTSILWYGLTNHKRPIRQLRRSKLKLPTGGNFKLTDIFIGDPTARDQRIAVFGSALVAEIDEATPTTGQPLVVYVGATGGLREQLELGTVTNEDVEYLRAQLVNQIPQLVLAVVSGEQEASWELSAAHAIYQPLAGTMFPSISQPVEFGLFSGGGSSMQVQESAGGAPHSFGFTTWCKAIDEGLGAPADAWKDQTLWGAWEDSLVALVKQQASKQPKFEGCFVLTAMNHVASTAAGFAETPISAEHMFWSIYSTRSVCFLLQLGQTLLEPGWIASGPWKRMRNNSKHLANYRVTPKHNRNAMKHLRMFRFITQQRVCSLHFVREI